MKNYNIGLITLLMMTMPAFVFGKINTTDELNKKRPVTHIYNVNDKPASVIHHTSIEVHYDLIDDNKTVTMNKSSAPRMIIWNDVTGDLVDQHLIDIGQNQTVTFNNLEVNVPYRVELIARYNLDDNPNSTSVYVLNEQQFIIDSNQVDKEKESKPDEFYSAIKTSDGGYIAVGKIHSDEGNGELENDSDGLLVKFDSEGNSIWSRVYHKKKIDNFYTVVETNDGGYAIVGETSNINSDQQSVNTNNAGLLVKFDNAGNPIWDKVYKKNDSSGFYSLIENSNGEYVIVGYSVRNNPELENNHHQISDSLLVKFDNKGHLVWEKNYEGDDHSEFYSILETDDEGYFVVGVTKQNTKEPAIGNGNIDAISVQFDSEGNFVSDRIYNGSEREEFYLVVKNSEGGYSLATEEINNEENDSSVAKFPIRLF